MTGRPSKKIQCMARRKYDGNQCQCKGIKQNNGRYICRYHGGLSTGPKSLEGKIRALKNLIQYKDKNYEEIKGIIAKNSGKPTIRKYPY